MSHWSYLALQIYWSCRLVVIINYKCPKDLLKVGCVSRVLAPPTLWDWGVSLPVCGCYSIQTPTSLIKKSFLNYEIFPRWYSNTHIVMRLPLILIHLFYSPLFLMTPPCSRWLTFIGFFATVQQRWPHISTGKIEFLLNLFPDMAAKFLYFTMSALKMQWNVFINSKWLV